MKRYITMAAAGLLWAGAVPAEEATRAPAPAGDTLHQHLRDGTGDANADRLREQARDRMHQALAEQLPAAPRVAAGAGAMDRERERARDEAANRAAEKHALRRGAAQGTSAHEGAGHHGGMGPGSGMGPGDGMGPGNGDCTDAAGQHRMMEMHGDTTGGGTMDGSGGGTMGGHH